MSPETIAEFVPGKIKASTVNGELRMLPRARFDVSVLYYLKSNDTDAAIVVRFYEMLVAEGGNYLDENKKPIFNSAAGQSSQWGA